MILGSVSPVSLIDRLFHWS